MKISALDLVSMRPQERRGRPLRGRCRRRSLQRTRDLRGTGWRSTTASRGWPAPRRSVLIGHVAGQTKTIRVGSGGVMLPNHPPLVVAEQFGTLASLYPDRIDLGLGRAPGSDAATMRAMRRDLRSTGDEFPELLMELQRYLGAPQPGQTVQAIPGQNTHVPITLLGSSGFSAQLAGQLGLPFAFAAHFAPDNLEPAVELYRQNFRPSATLKAAVCDGGHSGDRGGDGRGGAAAVHDAAAAFSGTDSQSAGGGEAAGGQHGRAVEPDGARSGCGTAACGDCG